MNSILKYKIWVLTFVGLLVLASAVAIAMNESLPSGTWRYRMTVTVETPEGLKTGSAVREVHFAHSKPTPPSKRISGIKRRFKGEAVAVNLGERGVLFALLKGYVYGNYYEMIPRYAFPTEPGYYTTEGFEYYSQLKDAKTTLTPTQYPMFVMFRDINDPKTIVPLMELEPDNQRPPVYSITANHFEKYFGEGVKLKEITIEMTDDPVTWGIEEFIAWLPGRKGVKGPLGGSSTYPYDDPSKTYLKGIDFSRGTYLHGGSTSRGAPLGLHLGDFRKGVTDD